MMRIVDIAGVAHLGTITEQWSTIPCTECEQSPNEELAIALEQKYSKKA
jgi:hypothetical protein